MFFGHEDSKAQSTTKKVLCVTLCLRAFVANHQQVYTLSTDLPVNILSA